MKKSPWKLDPLFTPRSIAVIGASPNGGAGSIVLRNMQRLGYTGTVYPINPKYKEIFGYPCYASLRDLPAPADCAAVLLGNTVSEGVSCGVMLAFAARTPEFVPRPGAPLHPYTRKELYDILWPVEGSRLLASALQAAESSLIPYTLALCTGSRTEAVAQYGSLKGMALPLLFFPFSVLTALSGLLMPEITRAHTARDTAALRRLVRLAMGLTGGFSLLVGAALVLFGKDAAILLYHDAQAGRYVQVLGFVAPFMYLESMVDAILKGMGEQLATFRYSVLDSILRIAGILWLMPQYGMPGFLAVMTASNLLTCGLNTGRMVRQLRREEVGTEREMRN